LGEINVAYETWNAMKNYSKAVVSRLSFNPKSFLSDKLIQDSKNLK